MADVPVYDLGNPTWIRVTAVPETPPTMTVFDDRYLSVPNTADMPALGTRGIVQVSGVTLHGYLRQVNGAYEWVILPPQDPIEPLIDQLPGPVGWTDPAARGAWLGIAAALRGYGVTGADLATGLPALYNAAKANLLAEYGVK